MCCRFSMATARRSSGRQPAMAGSRRSSISRILCGRRNELLVSRKQPGRGLGLRGGLGLGRRLRQDRDQEQDPRQAAVLLFLLLLILFQILIFILLILDEAPDGRSRRIEYRTDC